MIARALHDREVRLTDHALRRLRERTGLSCRQSAVDDFLAAEWMTAEQMAAYSDHGYARYNGSLFALSPAGVVYVVKASLAALVIVTVWRYGTRKPKQRPVKRKRGRR